MSINYLSPLVEKQLPGFVREENPNFVTFLEKYYEWMETSGNPIYENYNLLNAKDVDLANDYFIKQIKDELSPSFPEEILLDDVKFLKTINQFYRSKGTPDSIKFLFKVLYNENIDIYFPSNEILKLSDGKWVLPLALRVETADPNVFNLIKTQIRGTTSDATAIIEKVVSSIDRTLGIQYIELFVSNINRLFATGETLTASYVDGEDTITVNAKLIGSLSEIKIDPKNRGLFYKDNDPRGLFYYPEDVEVQYGGDPVTFVGGLNEEEGSKAKPAEAVVGEVLKGQINEIITVNGGFGFRRSIYPNTSIIDFKGGFASGRLGQESKAEIILVDEKNYRTINVSNYEIQSFSSNTINSIDNVANNKTINEITTKQSLNLYSIAFLSAVSSGGGYSSRPDIETYSFYNESLDDELVISSAFVTRKTNIIRDNSQDLTDFLEKGDIVRLYVKNRFEQVETVQEVTSNTLTIGTSFETNINNLQVYKVNRRNLTQLGSLGRIQVVNGGSNYNVGDYLIFSSTGRGYGANAQVTQVHAGNNGIKAAEFNESSAYVRGGEGYTLKDLPTITINSNTGSNAQLVIPEILGDGEKVEISTSRIGAISKIKVISYGYDYTSAPIISLRNADLYLSNVTEGLLFTSNSKVYQGTSNTNTTFEAYFDKYVTGNTHVRIFNYIGTFDDTKQLKSFDDTISADILDYVFFGNGKAKATAKFENGLIRYPGIYLNEDGQPSSEKRFQDANKYHNFSYVINTENDYKKFSKTLSDVLHPTGTKSFVTRIKKFDTDATDLRITSNNYITTPLSNTFNVFVGTGIAMVTGDVANVNLASSIAVGDTIVFRNLLKTLNGTVSYVSGSNTITGNGTNFINDIYDGQVIKLVSGNSETVAYVTNANSIITQNTLTSTVTDGTISLYYDEVDTVTFVNSNTIFVSTLFEDVATFVSANLKIDLGSASSLRDIRMSTQIASINIFANEANNFTPISATGGIGGISKYIVSPLLPDGLVMISSNGNIRGTPTVLKTPTTYTVTALDKRSRGANATFTLGINPAPLIAIQSIASRTLTANTLATTFKPVTPSGGYGSIRYTITPSLPAGVTFDPYSGDVGGVPGAIVTANTYTISMTDDVGQNSSNTFALTITPIPIVTSTIIATKSITTRIGNAFTPITSTGGFGGLTYEISPSLPTGLTFNTANGYISGNTTTTLVANTFTVTANDRAGQSVSNTFTLTVSAPTPITATTVINFKSLTANSADPFTPVTATGGYGNLTYQLLPYLPSGLSYSASNGLISGASSELSSNAIYTIIITDEYPLIQTSSNTFTMNVVAPALTSTMTTTSSNLIVGVPSSFNTLNVSGGYGEITYNIDPALPTGLTLNTSNGYVYGTLTSSLSLTTYTVTANDQGSQVTSNTFTLKVNPELRTSRLITSRTLNANVANSFLPVIAVTPQVAQSGNTYYFDGVTSGIGLRTDPGSALFFSTGDFTVEFWIKGNSASQAANSTIAVSHGTVSTFRYKTLHIAVGSALSGTSGKLYFSPGIDAGAYNSPSLDRLITPNSVLDDTWHHIACVRSSGTAYIFVDGVKVANSNTGTWAVSTFLSQGSLGANSYTTSTDQMFTGYLSNFRALKNQALYTSNFTPPISTLTSTSNTRLLLNSSSVVDSGPNTIPFNANTALPTVGTSVVFQPGYVNLTTGIAYSISPSLPTGLSFNVSNGFISGNTAQTVIANTYTVTVTDDVGQTNSATFIMNVVPAMIMTTSITSRYPYIGEDPNFTPATATGGIAPITYSINGLGSNTIPYGTTLNSANGKISGTILLDPTVSANYYARKDTIKIVATDAVGQQVSSANIYIEIDGVRLPFTANNYGTIYANTTYESINIGTVAAGLGSVKAFLVPGDLSYANAFSYPLAFSNVIPGMTWSFSPASNTIFLSGTPTKAIGFQYGLDEFNELVFLGAIDDPTSTRDYTVQVFDDTTTWRSRGYGYSSFINIDIRASKFYANTTTPVVSFETSTEATVTPITVSGGYGVNGNITFALSGNTLPDGLTFITTNGAITGTATSLANANTFTITANDDSFQTASNTFTLAVVASTLTLLPTSLYSAYKFIPAFMDANNQYYGTGFSYTNPMLSSNGGAGNITFTVTGANTLPSGTFLYTMTDSDLYAPIQSYERPGNRYVAIGGVSEEISTKYITITANDDSGQSVTQTFSIYTSSTTGENTFGYDGPPFANSVQAFGPWYSFVDDTHSTIDIGANTSINLTLANVPSWSVFGNLSVTLSGNTLPDGLTLSTVPVANAWPPYLFGRELVPDAAFTEIRLTGNVNSTVSTNNYSLVISTNTTSNTGIHYSNSIGVFALTVLQPAASVNALSFNTGKLSYYDYDFGVITEFLGQTATQQTAYNDQHALKLPSNTQLIIANTVPYTVELWMKLLGDGGWGDDYALMSSYNNHFNVYWNVFGELTVQGRSGGSQTTINNIKHLGDDKWHHLAFVRTSGNNMKVYIDGYLVANSSAWTRFTESSVDFSNLIIGKYTSTDDDQTPFRGEISNFRITKTALYTANTYTVPSLPLRPIVNTVLLIANSSNALYDSSNNHLNIGIANSTPIAIKSWPRITRPSISVTMTDPNNNIIVLNKGQTVYPSFAPAVNDVTLAKIRGGFGDYSLTVSPSFPAGSGLEFSPYYTNNTPAFSNTVMNVHSLLQTYTLTATDRITGLTASNTFNLRIAQTELTLNVAYPGDEEYYGAFARGLDANVNPRYTSEHHVPLFTSNGGVGNITFEVTGANTLPAGMFAYSNTAKLADSNFAPAALSDRYVYFGGRPEDITNTTITITANDEFGQSVSSSHVFKYMAPLVAVDVPEASLAFGLGAVNTTILSVSSSFGGYGNVTYEITGNTLPTGLSFITSNAGLVGTTSETQALNTYTVTAVTSSGIYYSNVSSNVTITVFSGTPQNVMSFNEAGSGFDEFDTFTWQGLLPNDSTQLVLSSATPFTVEFWLKHDNIPSAFIINTDAVNTGSAFPNGVNFWYNNGESFFSINGSGSGSRIVSGAVDIFDSQWHHVALVRNGSSGKMFIDGIQQASTTSWGGINSTLQYAFIGNYQLAGDVFFGKLSNFRVTKTALYTTDFTVPSLPLVPIANTVLLLNSATPYDSSNNHLAVVALNVLPTYQTAYI